MNFSVFRRQFAKFTVFSLNDIRKVEPQFYRSRLNDWQDKKYVTKIRRGYYVFTDDTVDEDRLFAIANRVYAPSYVSLESALSRHGLIPEGVYTVTSVSSRKTYAIKSAVGFFSYRKIKPSALLGYSLVRKGGLTFKIAEPEKAVLDYLYLNPQVIRPGDFKEWRFNSADFLAKADLKKMRRYAETFGSRRLTRGLVSLLRLMKGHD